MLFGVCDGHGLSGHFVSAFVKKRLPQNLTEALEAINDPKKSFEAKDELAIRAAFKKTDQELISRRTKINCNYSGTTVVTVMIKDDNLICANVGDSRAVLASYKPIEAKMTAREGVAIVDEERMKWISHPLSRDHKPDIPEEKERINISGGRVSSYIEVDPVTGIKI